MKTRRVSIRSATTVSKVLWPEFVVVNDLVFFSWAAPEMVDLNMWYDKTEVEQYLNHTHVLDLFSHRTYLDEDPWIDQSHEDFKLSCEFGVMWVETVAEKLAKDFPDRNFWVYYTEQDNPIIRFHQDHPKEIPWLRKENFLAEIEKGTIIIKQVFGYNKALKAQPRAAGTPQSGAP